MTPTAQRSLLALALLAAMAATRSQHFASLLGPGDTSMAVFFLGGLYLRRMGWLGLFLATAAVIDFAAIQGGISGWCVTPGYALLAPAYGALWLAGRTADGITRSAAGLARGGLLLAVGTLAFFVVSNAGFYFLSDYFGELELGEFALRVSGYLPGYLTQAFLYSGLGLALGHVTRRTLRQDAANA